MATSKKKSVTITADSGDWPKVVQGSHLTVKTYENGRTELVWDDAQLLKDVQLAMQNAVYVTPVKPKTKSTVSKKKK